MINIYTMLKLVDRNNYGRCAKHTLNASYHAKLLTLRLSSSEGPAYHVERKFTSEFAEAMTDGHCIKVITDMILQIQAMYNQVNSTCNNCPHIKARPFGTKCSFPDCQNKD